VSREFLALVSLHHGHHNKTPADRFGGVESGSPWCAEELAIDALLGHVLAGKAWVGCQLQGGKRNAAAAGASNLIVLDIDGDLNLEAFWANSFAARHCLLTYTSCSHNPDGEHRFRAIFPCEVHSDADLHRAIYQQVLDALGFAPKDASGEKPERLWYGNDKADVRFGAGEPLSWDLVERAKDALAAELARRSAPRPEATEQDQQRDNERAAYALQHLLQPSSDGEFNSYWSPVLNAAAATGSEQVREAFLDWHHRGHHSKSQKGVEKRFDKAGTKISAGQGAGQILSFAKQQHGSEWWRQLPEHLWFGGGGAGAKPPTVLMRARSAADIAPAGGTVSFSKETTAAVPNTVPSAGELQKLAARASIMQTSAKAAAAQTSEPVELTLADKLRRLYMLRAYGILQTGDDLEETPKSTRAFLDRELLGEVLGHPGYCNQPSEVERDLLKMFRNEHGLEDNAYDEVEGCRLTGTDLPRPRWLIPGFLLVGGEHVLYAKAGVGKTTLALHMVRAVTGDPELDNFLDSGPLNNHHLWQQSQVIFIGTDMYRSAKEMTSAYLSDFQLAGLDFLKQVEWWFEQTKPKRPGWVLCLKDLIKLYNTLQGASAAGAPVTAVFIDSMKAVCPDHLLVGQQGFKDYIKLVREICGEFNAALIWVHHSSADGSRAQGISRITEGSDANLHLKRDDKTKQISLDVEKIRGGGVKGRARTLYINPFKHIPQLLPNPEEIPAEDNLQEIKASMVLEVLAAHFKQHRLLNMTSSAQYIEKNYLGMKIGQISDELKKRFSGSASMSKSTLLRTLNNLKDAGRIGTKGSNSYCLPPHFQLDLPDQQELSTDGEDTDYLPGW